MTEAAQQALRRTMEIYSNTTRFALACNNSEKIIEPIQSRCAMLRYSKLTDPQILAKLLDVCEKEKVDYTEDGMDAVIFTSQVFYSNIAHHHSFVSAVSSSLLCSEKINPSKFLLNVRMCSKRELIIRSIFFWV